MNVKSMFEFKFSETTREEGLRLAEGVGRDMPACAGYVSHEVIQDIKDPGHVMVNTRWATGEQADAVLSKYNQDPKIKRITELLKGQPGGFVGNVLPSST